MQIETILVQHPTLKGQVMRINKDSYDPAKHKLIDEPPAPPVVINPAVKDMKATLIGYDKSLGTEIGIKELIDKEIWPNARAKELADLLGIKHGLTESGDNIRSKVQAKAAEIMKG